MSTVIDSTPDNITLSGKFPYALIEGAYDRVADNVWLNSKRHLVMHGTKGIELSDFQDQLVDEDRHIMQCNCCKDFFRKYSNLLVIKPNGVIESAMFRNVETSNQNAKALFNRLADIVEGGTPSHFVDTNLRGNQPNIKIRVGVKHAGNFPHYHGFISRQNLSEKASFEESVTAFTNLLSKYKGIDELADAMEAINPAFMREKEVPINQREDFDANTKLISKFRNARIDALSLKHAVASLWGDNTPGLAGLIHFNGNILGNLIENFIREGDYEKAVSLFLKRTDPLVYKKRETAKASKQQLEVTKKFIKENGYATALVHRISAPEDIESIWQTTPEVKSETEAEVDLADELFDDKIKAVSDTKPPVYSDEIWPSATNITRTHFIHKVLAEAERIWIPISIVEKVGVLHQPVDAEAKPIFFWTEQRPTRPYVTCIPHDRVHLSNFGWKDGYRELDLVAELPWFGEGIKREGALSDGWMLGFKFKPVEEVPYYGLQSFGGALKGELQPHRLGIDTVIAEKKLAPPTGEFGIAYMQLSHKWTYKNVRVKNKDGSNAVYTIMDVE